MATERRQQIIDWLRDSGNPRAEELLNSLAQMNTDEWEQKHRRDLRKIMGYADIEKNTLPLRDRARGEFDTYVDNPEWYIKGKAAKLGVNVNDLKKALSELEEERKWNEGRERRTKEVNEDFIWNFAPKSSQQRYIDDPNAPIFGKEGSYNPLSKEGQDDFRDVTLGIAGTVGDFIPGYGAAVGPAARTLRNEELIRTNSPYAPSLVDAGKEALNDWSTYGAAAWLQNFRKAKRMAAGAEKSIPGLEKITKNANTTAEIDNTATGLLNVFNANNYDEMTKAIQNLPNNEVKNRLMSKLAEGSKIIGNPDAEAKLVNELKLNSINDFVNLNAVLGKTKAGYKLHNPEDVKQLFVKHSKTEEQGLKRADEALNDLKNIRQQVRNTPEVGKFGQFIRDIALPVEQHIEQGVAKNATSMYKAGPKDTDRAKIDWYKQNYARDWEMGFAPKGKETDPMVKAYNEWLAEHSPTINNVFGQ